MSNGNRGWLRGVRGATAAGLMLVSGTAMAAGDVVMHRDPGCGCCEKWAAQAGKQLGRKIRVIDNPNRPALQRAMGMKDDLASCHTALIDGYAFEGHVPIADVKRLLAARPKGVRGLAVPGMPLGSPGMEVPGGQKQPYAVIAFGPAGNKIYARH